MGDNKQKVLKELDNWPTYYSSELTKAQIKKKC